MRQQGRRERGRATDLRLLNSYSHGFLALVLQVFHLAERAEDWSTTRTRRTRRRREVECIVSRARLGLETDWRSGETALNILHHHPPSSLLSPPHLSLPKYTLDTWHHAIFFKPCQQDNQFVCLFRNVMMMSLRFLLI